MLPFPIEVERVHMHNRRERVEVFRGEQVVNHRVRLLRHPAVDVPRRLAWVVDEIRREHPRVVLAQNRAQEVSVRLNRLVNPHAVRAV